MTAQTLPAWFISHGGGPWPYIEGPFRRHFDKLELALRAIAASLPQQPRAVLMISGHWEEGQFTLSCAAKPGMIYDYSGFPEHTYQVQYPAPGEPQLAREIQQRLQQAGFEVALDPERGYDHGTFSTMAAIFPDADIPIVQLSMKKDFDPAVHIALGRALAPLREQGILIIGSGLSYHNLRAFGPSAAEPSRQFDQWLQQTLLELDGDRRAQQLTQWEKAPAARMAHPREDHLIPLMVVLGAAYDDVAVCDYHEDNFFGHIHVSNFRFGAI